jgi:uncharacterized protein YfaT (DUF1175 family)
VKSGLSIRFILIFLAGLLLCGAGAMLYIQSDSTVRIFTQTDTLYADHASTAFFKIGYANPVRELISPFHDGFSLCLEQGQDLVTIIEKAAGFFLQSRGKSGVVCLKVRTASEQLPLTVSIVDNENDADGDGFPDVVELDSEADRTNFCQWFTAIAESQFYAPAQNWYDMHKDCAGLVVFAYKEALKKHDRAWFDKFPYLVRRDIPDIQKYNYPYLPLLGDNIFRLKSGGFRNEDTANGAFAAAVNVNNLINYNLTFISKDPGQFKQGDILFFLHTENHLMPFHSMIYTGEQGWLIYHTGPLDDQEKGEVRKVALSALLKHPDKSWIPTADNPCFLGAYRFNILL